MGKKINSQKDSSNLFSEPVRQNEEDDERNFKFEHVLVELTDDLETRESSNFKSIELPQIATFENIVTGYVPKLAGSFPNHQTWAKTLSSSAVESNNYEEVAKFLLQCKKKLRFVW